MADNKQYIKRIQKDGAIMISEDVIGTIVAHRHHPCHIVVDRTHHHTADRNDDEYDIVAFDMKEDLTASVIMVTSSNGEADEASSLLVVDKITKVEDEDGNTVEKLYAYQDGKAVTFVTEEELESMRVRVEKAKSDKYFTFFSNS